MKRLEVLNRIQEIYAKLEENRLEPNEIEELVDLSNNLYERALILRYKVAEQRIFRKEEEQSTSDIANETDVLSEVSIQDGAVPEPIDFSIFESVEEKILEEELISEIEEPVNVEEVIEKNLDPIELNFHDSSTENKIEKVETIAEPAVEVISETKQEQVEVPTGEDNWSVYFDKVLKDHSSSIQKSIETLAGSFGLNERILYINELFNGEAEKFSNAVLKIDKTEDWTTCKKLINEMALQENWDKESDTIGEFVLHVKRKHA